MSSSLLRRTSLVFLLIAALSTSWAAAAGPKAPAASQAPTPAALHLLSRAWSLLTSLWSEEGCNVDPNGRCVSNPVQVGEGCIGDPDGRCVTPKVDTGCNGDPDGRCTP